MILAELVLWLVWSLGSQCTSQVPVESEGKKNRPEWGGVGP